MARIRWEPRRGGHIQAAGLGRQLRGEPADNPTELVGATGAAFNISGRLPSFLWSERDQILFQQNFGSGIGRYITDLGTIGGRMPSTIRTLGRCGR